MKCPDCGVENLEGIRFCNYCGKEFPKMAPAAEVPRMMKCQNCGFNNPDGSLFCNQCGKDMRVSIGPTVASPLSNTKPCTSCGRMIPIDANLCPYCRYNYRTQAVPAAPTPMKPIAPAQPAYQPQPAQLYPQYQFQSAGSKPCVFCGKSIPMDANICPYCTYKYRK